jgi:hypothetical protein
MGGLGRFTNESTYNEQGPAKHRRIDPHGCSTSRSPIKKIFFEKYFVGSR